MAPKKETKVKKKNIKLPEAKIFITTTDNNTIVTLTDPAGNVISSGGGGTAGFKGSKKSTPYAAELVAKRILKEAKDSFGLKDLWVIAKGMGMGRDGVFKAINEVGDIEIKSIVEATALQFGGCKRPRPRRN